MYISLLQCVCMLCADYGLFYACVYSQQPYQCRKLGVPFQPVVQGQLGQIIRCRPEVATSPGVTADGEIVIAKVEPMKKVQRPGNA